MMIPHKMDIQWQLFLRKRLKQKLINYLNHNQLISNSNIISPCKNKNQTNKYLSCKVMKFLIVKKEKLSQQYF